MEERQFPSRSAVASWVSEAATQLERASAAKKCWPCGCFHDALKAIERAIPEKKRPVRLTAIMLKGTSRLTERRYECLGCDVCYPALALNALDQAGARIDAGPCPTEKPEQRAGWPPLPGDYTAIRYHAPVAICTLNDDQLSSLLVEHRDQGISIVGTLRTENLGIERLVANVLANPNIRFLILCGADSRQAIGHLPGQSLLSLARIGLDERGRIIGARGKRPVLRNIGRDAVEHFRSVIEVLDLVGENDAGVVLDQTRACVERDPGRAQDFAECHVMQPVRGYLPDRMIPDPAGYFVIYVDRDRGVLTLEHYTNEGMLDALFAGSSAAELYTPAIERDLISRLDHAAYLGRELARAEAALHTGATYRQDGVPVP